jgi:hypothetical protein
MTALFNIAANHPLFTIVISVILLFGIADVVRALRGN